MKKFLLSLVAFVGLSVGAQAAETEDVSIETMGWSYNAEYAYADGIGTITLTGDWGQASTGWNDALDWSKYGTMTVVIESYNNDWGKIYIKNQADQTIEKTFSTISTTTEVSIDLTENAEVSSAVHQLAVQGKATGDVIKISRIYLTSSVDYGDGVSLTMDEWGNILASEFEKFSDDAKVVFTYKVTATKGSATTFNGWGLGSIKDIGGTLDGYSVNVVKQEGENSISYTVGELKTLLAAHDATYDRYGLIWNVWGQKKPWDAADDESVTDQITVERVSVVVYEVAEETSTPVRTISTDAEVISIVYYNVLGVEVAQPQKGINIVKETLSDGTTRTRKIVK